LNFLINSKYRYYRYILIVLFTLFVFKTTLRTINPVLQVLPILMLIVFIVFLYVKILQNLIISKNQIYIYILLSYFSFLVLVYNFIAIQHYTFTPYLGILQYLIIPIFWFIFYENIKINKDSFFNLIVQIIISFALLNSFGAIIQYFISPDLFGTIQNNTYTASTMDELKQHVTKRAISFISSPQSLGLFLGLSFALVIISAKKKSLKLGLILFAGLLTGSKIFILFIFTFLSLNSLKNNKLLFFLSLSLIVPIILIFQNDTLNRFIAIFSTMGNMSEYMTFLVWYSFVTYETSTIQFLFGHGLGVITASSQLLYEYKILNGSAESYLIQLYFETGIIGLLLFLYLYIKSILNFLQSKSNKQFAFILIALSISLIGTPSFFGFINSLCFYSIIIFGFLHNKKEYQCNFQS
jgi:hypothetical protein